MNARLGNGKVQRFGLREKRLGARVLLLDGRQHDLAALLRAAVDDGADLLGVAGGDGALALVAGVAAERDVPFLVIPAGTRNHFALDLGLDRSQPSQALDALIDGMEVVVDLGTAGARPFVNNVSLGAYAEIVERPDYRDNKLRVTLDVLPDVLSGREQQHFTMRIGAVTVTDPMAALISNNPYGTGNDVPSGRSRSPSTGRAPLSRRRWAAACVLARCACRANGPALPCQVSWSRCPG